MGNPGIDPALLTATPGSVIAAAIILPFLSTLAVALRFHARRWQHIAICADDLAVLASAVLIGLLGLILIVGSAIGSLGRHSAPLYGPDGMPTPDHGSPDARGERILMAYSAIEKPALGLTKISTVLLFRRIFKGHIFPKVAVATCIVLATMTLSFFIASLTQCPIGNWDSESRISTTHHGCAPQELITFGFAVADCVTDLFILALPLPIIWYLHMDLRQRLCMYLVFVLGTCSFIVAIVRAAIVGYFTWPGATAAGKYRDLIGIMSSTALLSLAEASLAVVATCIPTFRNLLATYCNVDFPGGSILLSRFEPSQVQGEGILAAPSGSIRLTSKTSLVASEEKGKHRSDIKHGLRCQSNPIATAAAESDDVGSQHRKLSHHSRSSCDLIVVQEPERPHTLRLTTTFPNTKPSATTSSNINPIALVTGSDNADSGTRVRTKPAFSSDSPISAATTAVQTTADLPFTRRPRNTGSKSSFSGGVSPLQELSNAASTLRAPTPTMPPLPAAFSPHQSLTSSASSPSSSTQKPKASSQITSSSSSSTTPISPLPSLPTALSLHAEPPSSHAMKDNTTSTNYTLPTTIKASDTDPSTPAARSFSPAELDVRGPSPVELEGTMPAARARTPAELEAEEMMMGTLRCYDDAKARWT